MPYLASTLCFSFLINLELLVIMLHSQIFHIHSINFNIWLIKNILNSATVQRYTWIWFGGECPKRNSFMVWWQGNYSLGIWTRSLDNWMKAFNKLLLSMPVLRVHDINESIWCSHHSHAALNNIIVSVTIKDNCTIIVA